MQLYKLMRGTESQQLIEILLESTGIRSESKKRALLLVYVNGYTPEAAANALLIDKRSLYRAIKRIQKAYELHEKYTNIRRYKY